MHDTVRLRREDLVLGFHANASPRDRWRVGAEFERFLLRPSGRPVGYDEPFGVRALLDALRKEGWRPVFEEARPISMLRGDSHLSLEPGGQLELSTSPHASLFDLSREVQDFSEELRHLVHAWPVRPVTVGLQPFSRIADIPWVPKSRYRVMRAYLPTKGDLAHGMMKGTCAVQASFDYGSEPDCARKVRAAVGIAPLLLAMTANSPFFEGRDTGWASYRSHIWTRTDPERTGFPAPLRAYSHEAWADWLIHRPMMFLKVPDGYVSAGNATFGDFMHTGIEGRAPAWFDWETHQTSVFPVVRIKRYLEVRCMDAVPPPLALSMVGLLTGILYDDLALDGALALGDAMGELLPVDEAHAVAAKEGLRGRVGRTLLEWSRDLVGLAMGGLERRGSGEAVLLDPLHELLERGRSPAEALREALTRGGDGWWRLVG